MGVRSDTDQVAQSQARTLSANAAPVARTGERRLGEILESLRVVGAADALLGRYQQDLGDARRLGEILVVQGLASAEQVELAIEIQRRSVPLRSLHAGDQLRIASNADRVASDRGADAANAQRAICLRVRRGARRCRRSGVARRRTRELVRAWCTRPAGGEAVGFGADRR